MRQTREPQPRKMTKSKGNPMIHIITDTGSDLTLAQAAAMDVELVPMSVSFGEHPYDQLADEHFSLFYKQLTEEKALPVTSQPSPGDFLARFLPAVEAGDSVVAILLSSRLSGTMQSALIAREMADSSDIYIIDSQQAAVGQRLLVEHAVALRAKGLTASEIAAVVTEMSGRVRLYAALDTLKYLRKGGRIPRSTEVLGTALGIKPIIQLAAGPIVMAGKARGHAGAVTSLVKLVEQHRNFDPLTPVYFAYTASEAMGGNFRKLACAHFKLKNTVIYPVGATIGTHIGPGAIALAYLERPDAFEQDGEAKTEE